MPFYRNISHELIGTGMKLNTFEQVIWSSFCGLHFADVDWGQREWPSRYHICIQFQSTRCWASFPGLFPLQMQSVWWYNSYHLLIDIFFGGSLPNTVQNLLCTVTADLDSWNHSMHLVFSTWDAILTNVSAALQVERFGNSSGTNYKRSCNLLKCV
jgi:hypothetical protein